MTSSVTATGSCLCGKVKVNVEQLTPNVGACHCGMCIKWGGGPLLAVDCGTAVSFEGEDAISVYDSSDWAERGFCSHCGTHLFYRLKESQQHIMPSGLFDDNSAFVLDHQIFIDKKPSFYNFSNQTKVMTGAEVFAMYAPPES